MGTLKNQPPRKYLSVISSEPDIAIEEIKTFSKKHKLTLEQGFQFFELLEKERRNSLYVQNGDAFDEQMSGFAHLIEDLKIKIEKVPKSHHLNEN